MADVETKPKTSPRDRALAQIETTKRVIERAEAKVTKAKADLGEAETKVADLKARLEYEKQHPALANTDADQPELPVDDEPDEQNVAGSGNTVDAGESHPS